MSRNKIKVCVTLSQDAVDWLDQQVADKPGELTNRSKELEIAVMQRRLSKMTKEEREKLRKGVERGM